MTLLYDIENEFCDRHPMLCSGEISEAVVEEDEYYRFDSLSEWEPEVCELTL